MHLAEIVGSSTSGWNLQLIILLLLVSSSVAAAIKWVKLPYSIALVITGLFAGITHLLPAVEMTPEIILVIMLPALLFEASWNLRLKDLKRDWLLITILATVGVVVSVICTAAVMFLFGSMSWIMALLFGAMISATDPISVLALFKKMGVNRRLTMLLEGESLFNDGTAVVIFKLVLVTALAGGSLSLTHAAGSFVTMVIGGAFLGLALGLGASKLTSYFDDHLLELTLTAILAYGSYLLAEAIHVSPVISTICAGVVMGNYGSRIGMSANTRQAVSWFWEYAAFIVNSLVFLLIGLQMKLDLLLKYSTLIGWGIVAIIASRAIIVYALVPLFSRGQHKIESSWKHVLAWGALRGSLSMALALSLPNDFPGKEAITVLTFGVVLFTLLVKGLTIEPLVNRLKISKDEEK